MSEGGKEVLRKCTGKKMSLKGYRRTPKHRTVKNEGSEYLKQ